MRQGSLSRLAIFSIVALGSMPILGGCGESNVEQSRQQNVDDEALGQASSEARYSRLGDTFFCPFSVEQVTAAVGLQMEKLAGADEGVCYFEPARYSADDGDVPFSVKVWLNDEGFTASELAAVLDEGCDSKSGAASAVIVTCSLPVAGQTLATASAYIPAAGKSVPVWDITVGGGSGNEHREVNDLMSALSRLLSVLS